MFGNAVSEAASSGDAGPLQPLAYEVPQVAVLLPITERQVWRLIDDGSLPSFKIGRRRLVAAKDLDAYVERKKAEEIEARAARST